MAQPQAIARFALAGARAARVSVVTRRRPHALRCVHARSDAAQMIQVGETLPDATLVEKHEEVKIRDVFKGKTGVLLGMPGELSLRSRWLPLALRVPPACARASRAQVPSLQAAPRRAKACWPARLLTKACECLRACCC